MYRLLICPALSQLGFEAYRIDHRAVIASIPNAIVEELRDADLCVAIVTFLNPNVMFEIGVRQAWDLPLIQLAQARTKLPFDIMSRYTVFYSLSKNGANAAIRDIVRVVKEIVKKTKDTPAGHVPSYSLVFGESMAQLGERQPFRAVFDAKRSLLEYLGTRLRAINEGIENDYEFDGMASIDDARPHREYLIKEFRTLRTQCHVFSSIVACRASNSLGRSRCDDVLKQIKAFLTLAECELARVFPKRAKKIDVHKLKSLIDDLIAKLEELRDRI